MPLDRLDEWNSVLCAAMASECSCAFAVASPATASAGNPLADRNPFNKDRTAADSGEEAKACAGSGGRAPRLTGGGAEHDRAGDKAKKSATNQGIGKGHGYS